MARARLCLALALLGPSSLIVPSHADESIGDISESNETDDSPAPGNDTSLAQTNETDDATAPENDTDLLALPSSPLGLFEQDVEGSRAKRIYGGVPAPEGYKYHTQIQIYAAEGAFSCGAVVVGERHLLTAGHCVAQKDVRSIVAWVGVDHKNDLEYSSVLKVKEYIVHPAYRGAQEDYVQDVAILVLEEPVSPDFVAARFALASPEYYKSIDPTSGIICGLGYTGPQSLPARLQCAALPISQGSKGLKCRSPGVDTEKMICSVISDTGATCSGDSGSGIYHEHESNRLVLLGLTSFGMMKTTSIMGRPARTCPSGKTISSFFTKMPVLLAWINSFVDDLLVVDGCGAVVEGAAFFSAAQIDGRGCVKGGDAVDPVPEDFSPDPDVIFPDDSMARMPSAGLAMALAVLRVLMQA